MDDVDRRSYLGLLEQVITRTRWHCLAFCLMDNHLHLLVETPEPNLGRGMQQLHSRFAESFNARHGRDGHHFQGRYGATRVTTDAQLLMTTRYIALNPVVAGIVERATQWPWGSHAAVTGDGAPRPAWLHHERLLELLSGWGGDPAERYAELVAAS